MILPMISPSPSERIAAGWEFRFVAEGARAEEMIELYRELGFEVAADPVAADGIGTDADDCVACQELAADRFTAVYTRGGPPSGTTEGQS